MEKYTIEERRTILYVLTEVMLADEILHPAEQDFFNKVFYEINADVADMTAMEHIDNNYALEVFHRMSEEKQSRMRKTLYDMAMADGVLDYREQQILDFYA